MEPHKMDVRYSCGVEEVLELKPEWSIEQAWEFLGKHGDQIWHAMGDAMWNCLHELLDETEG